MQLKAACQIVQQSATVRGFSTFQTVRLLQQNTVLHDSTQGNKKPRHCHLLAHILLLLLCNVALCCVVFESCRVMSCRVVSCLQVGKREPTTLPINATLTTEAATAFKTSMQGTRLEGGQGV